MVRLAALLPPPSPSLTPHEEPHPVVLASLASASSDLTLTDSDLDTLLLSPASSAASLDTAFCDSDCDFDLDTARAEEKLASLPSGVFFPRYALLLLPPPPPSPAGALVPVSPTVSPDVGAQKAQAPLPLPTLSPSLSSSSSSSSSSAGIAGCVRTHDDGEPRKKTRRGGRKVRGWERRARQHARREVREHGRELPFGELEVDGSED